MADNRLRCALVYRLDAGDETSVTMLAKYDHASQYETSPGGSDLYGGRDKSYADAVGMVIGNDPPGATSEAGCDPCPADTYSTATRCEDCPAGILGTAPGSI